MAFDCIGRRFWRYGQEQNLLGNCRGVRGMPFCGIEVRTLDAPLLQDAATHSFAAANSWVFQTSAPQFRCGCTLVPSMDDRKQARQPDGRCI